MAELHFEITADNTQFVESVRQIQQGVRQASATIEQVGKNFDISSLDEQLVSLTKVIRDNEEAMQRACSTIAKYSTDAKQALDIGDIGTFNAINDDIADQIVKLQQLEAETNNYQQALSTIQQMMGSAGGDVSAPMLFGSQEDYDRVMQMRDGIAQLQEQIANFSGSEAELNALRARLSEQQKELHAVELAAAKAASAYGADLGWRASEAAERLHSLNNAVTEQERAVAELREQAVSAAEALANLGESADPTEIERAQIAYDNAAVSLQNAEMTLVNLQTAQAQAQTDWAATTAEMERHDSVLVKMLGGQQKYNAILAGMPPALQSAITGLQGMTGAAKAFIATPLGAVVAALVMAWQALTSWFNSSKEGQLAFAKVSGYTSGILNQLKEIAIKVGKVLYMMFTEPKKAIGLFWDAVKKNVVNRLKAVGDIAKSVGEVLKSALTADWEGVKSGYKRLMDSFLQFATGVENVSDRVAGAFKKIHESASENANIAVEKKQLEMEVSEWQKTKAKLDKKKATAQRKMYDTNLSAAERKKAADDYKNILQQQTDAEKRFADKRVELQKRSMELTTNTIEDYNELNRLEAESIQVEAQHEQQLASLQRRLNMINRAAGAGGSKKGAVQNAKEFEAAIKAMVSAQEQLENAVKDTEVSLTENALDKELGQINRAYEKAVDALNKKRKEYEQNAKKAGLPETDEEYKKTLALFDKQQKLLEKVRDRQLDDAMATTRQAMLDFLKEWGSFEQQRLAITEEYSQKIAKAQSPAERASLMMQRDKALKELEKSHLNDTIDWSGVFSDLRGHTKEYLQGLADQLQRVIKDGTLPPDQLAVAQGKLRDINAELSKQGGLFDFVGEREREHTRLMQEAQDAQDALAASREREAEAEQDALDARRQALGELIEQERDAVLPILSLFDIDESELDKLSVDDEAVNKFFKELLSSLDQNSPEYKQAQSVLDLLLVSEAKLADARKETAKATDKAKRAEDSARRETAQAVADWFSDAQQFIKEKGLGQLPELFGELGLDGLAEKASQGLSAFNNAAGAAADFATGNFIGAATKAIGAVMDLGGLLGIGGESDKTLAEDLERLSLTNEALRISIEALTDKMDDSAVADAPEIYRQMQEDIKQSEQNTQEQMRRSGAAYKSGWGGKHSSNAYIDDNITTEEWRRISRVTNSAVRNAGDFWKLTSEQMHKVATEAPDVYARIKQYADDGYRDAAQYMDDYIGYWEQLEEAEKRYYEKLTSTSLDSLTSEFTSALMDMDSSAQDFADNFEKYMQNAIINSLVSEKYQPLLEGWYKQLAEAMEDGMLSVVEEDALRREWDSITAQGLRDRERLRNMFGWGGTSEGSGAYSASKSFSQEQGDELNGRLTSIQIGQEAVRRDVSACVETLRSMAAIGTETQNILLSSNSHLEDIARYTRIASQFGDKLDRIITNTDKL